MTKASQITPASGSSLTIAPGSIVLVRDEEWLVTATEPTASNKLLVRVQGLSELVRDTTAVFYESLDDIEVVDPRKTRVIADGSSHYKDTRLWLEANRRKTPVPLADTRLTVSTRMLADTLKYQEAAVLRALDPDLLKPRILLADAVGLGKTIEIGMILSELVRRGRGERVLVVTPRHVLEQMQHELWSRFSLPFVRLDSVGIQKVRQNLPANRNPFTFYKRAIISIDTLKSDRYVTALRKQRWDAVVIDEAHNLTNSATLNNRLARTLARNTDALILASATPHNGRKDSFAEIVRLLDPTAVSADGEIDMERAQRLIIRRHRHSPEVAGQVGAEWAERKEPNNILVPASPSERAVSRELAQVWLGAGQPPSGSNALFPWTLAKAFLSSPAALEESIDNRLKLTKSEPERQSLTTLRGLNSQIFDDSAKYDRLVTYLRDEVGVGGTKTERAVIFAERVPTLRWLAEKLPKDLKLKPENVAILHGGLSDEEQQRIVDSFKQEQSSLRVLVTGDVASEGVNLHAQCHNLVHYDIPFSLIRIEQRNGRIDRYGQRTPPQITTLLLDSGEDEFSGDIRVLQILVEKEHEAHKVLGEAGSLMGEYLETREEDAIRDVLAGKKKLDDVVSTPEQVLTSSDDPVAALLAKFALDEDTIGTLLGGKNSENGKTSQNPVIANNTGQAPTNSTQTPQDHTDLFASDMEFLDEALTCIYSHPEQAPKHGGGGISWRKHPDYGVASFVPPKDFRTRLNVLPQSYLKDRRVADEFVLATTKQRGTMSLRDALADTEETSWPAAHFLGPLHPVLDWACDNVMSKLDRSQVFVAQTGVDQPLVALHGLLTNRAGQVVSSIYVSAEFFSKDDGTVNLDFCAPTVHESLSDLLSRAGLAQQVPNLGALPEAHRLSALMSPAIDHVERSVQMVVGAAHKEAQRRVDAWVGRLDSWQASADGLARRRELTERREAVAQERALVEQMAPDRLLVRPLFVVVPQGFDCVAAGLPTITTGEPATSPSGVGMNVVRNKIESGVA
ncbi:DEAD/DEAH box helicase [Populibacterium corticicola]|uniref:DEAD/DEAH box helicase n=1 Tax=Populibacterium corticicola TaxID=1812826 RepID=A0ABW5XD87_9MICO